MKMMVRHLWSAHKVEQASLLRYSCRVCDGQFNTKEEVIKHSSDHKIEKRKRSIRRSRSNSSTECIEGRHSRRSSSKLGRRSSSRHRRRSPSRHSRRPPDRRSQSRHCRRSPSRQSRRSPKRYNRSASRQSRRSPKRYSRSSSRQSRRSPKGYSRSPSKNTRRSQSRHGSKSPRSSRSDYMSVSSTKWYSYRHHQAETHRLVCELSSREGGLSRVDEKKQQ